MADNDADNILDEQVDNGDIDEDEDPLAHLPAYVVKRVEKLKELDEARDQVVKRYLEERAALEQKYSALYKPFYEQRASIIQGEKDKEIAEENDEYPENASAGEEQVKGIPQFWASAIAQNETIAEVITEDDVDCLEYLYDITCIDDEGGKGFTLRFHFLDNPYFHDTVLVKRYDIPNLLISDEPLLKNVVGCKIQWKPDMALTYRKVQKKQRGKGRNSGQIRTVTKTEDIDSFFRWFNPPTMPALNEIDEEEAEQLEELYDADFEIAEAFRSEIIPKAVRWFTGEVSSVISRDDDFHFLSDSSHTAFNSCI